MAADYKFEGWMGVDPEAGEGNMDRQEFAPKPWEETDVDIKITHCGICGSDLHTLRSGWGPTMYPCCVGHEIVGTAVRVGSQAENGIKVGDRVGVGAQSDSSTRLTYNARHWNGAKSYGGYGLYHRSPSHFVIKIPDAIPSALAAPMLFAGITTYSPLRHNGCGPGKKVGVIGVGGLGHYAIQFAKALEADRVVAISRRADKEADALALGADVYLATAEDPDWMEDHERSLDLIISTVSSAKMPLADYLSLLKTDGCFVQLGIPENGTLPIPAGSLIFRRLKLGGSLMGGPAEIREMLELAARKNVRSWVEEVPMKNANQAIQDMDAGKARYRYVLVNYC
ncbi:GroES-like protein [Aspergillus avenaceus]|uniref:alcohol dehydrogenase (NADP(+)) n=1 Tax=Aspergillus avenaceus TaxID=36643 RepID=A0A5N6TIA8_ASPAV|nr:GroES-like protein [Aspergillus avenaceus]